MFTGRWGDYRKVINLIKNEPSIQIGDMGIGFPKWHYRDWPLEHRYIFGNHDNPHTCKNHPNFLGKYGYLYDHNLYYIGGAYSVDKHIRVPGYDWWEEEELSDEEFSLIHNEIIQYKPKIILSHDAPRTATDILFNPKSFIDNRTSINLEKIFQNYQPNLWIFGHWHKSKQEKIKNTIFICLGELEFLQLPTNIKEIYE